MTAKRKQKWERVRAKGHASYIWRTFLFWGAPMWLLQTFGPLFYDARMHQPYTPLFQLWSPAADSIFSAVLWVFAFGYLMSDAMWRHWEREYHKDGSKTPA